MGFWIMSLFALVGIILIWQGSIRHTKFSRLLLIIIGGLSLLFAILLATPQGAELFY